MKEIVGGFFGIVCVVVIVSCLICAVYGNGGKTL